MARLEYYNLLLIYHKSVDKLFKVNPRNFDGGVAHVLKYNCNYRLVVLLKLWKYTRFNV